MHRQTQLYIASYFLYTTSLIQIISFTSDFLNRYPIKLHSNESPGVNQCKTPCKTHLFLNLTNCHLCICVGYNKIFIFSF